MSKIKNKKNLKKHSTSLHQEHEMATLDEQMAEEIRELLFAPGAEGMMEAVLAVSEMLEEAGVDTKEQKIVWPNGAHHDIDETAKLIKELTEIEVELPLLKMAVIGWLENVFVPEGANEQEMEYFEAQVEKWLRYYERKSGLNEQLANFF